LSGILQPTNGSILIDNVPISEIPLDQLRNFVSIVPQNLILFSGTIRTNIDPLDKHTDDEINEILQKLNIQELDFNKKVEKCLKFDFNKSWKKFEFRRKAIDFYDQNTLEKEQNNHL
jgi:ABC-type multidrug transport system fused ATPase/permease subunit